MALIDRLLGPARNDRRPRPATGRAGRRRSSPRPEPLEGRSLLSTLTVANLDDSGAGSLRDAVAAARSGDTIAFDPRLNGATITLTSGRIAIDKSLTIRGPGAAKLAVSGNGFDTILNINPGTTGVSVLGLTLEDGAGDSGGAIIVNPALYPGTPSAQLSLTDCVLTSNTAQEYGGAIFNWGQLSVKNCTFTGNSASIGGAVENYADPTIGTGTAVIVQSIFTGNQSNNLANLWYLDDRGGAVDNQGTLSLQGDTFSGNSAAYGNSGGGAICNLGQLGMTGTTLAGNSVTGYLGVGGGLSNRDGGTATIANSDFRANNASLGGGIDNDGSMTLQNSTITDNIADNSGGIDEDGPLTMIDCTVARNRADAIGGGLWAYGSVTLVNCFVTDNSSGDVGGGIALGNTASVSVSNSTIARNTAANDGGGLLVNDLAGLTLNRCLVADNHAGGSGGGIACERSGTLTVNASTLMGNSAGGDGGGVFIGANATAVISDSNVAMNAAGGDGGGIANESSATVGLTLTRTRVRKNAAPNGSDLVNWAYGTVLLGSTNDIGVILNLGTIV